MLDYQLLCCRRQHYKYDDDELMMSWVICIAQSAESSDQEIPALDPPLDPPGQRRVNTSNNQCVYTAHRPRANFWLGLEIIFHNLTFGPWVILGVAVNVFMCIINVQCFLCQVWQ